jgi:cysteine synthase A
MHKQDFFIGNTPLIDISALPGPGTLLAKGEYANPTGSAKDRAAWYMVMDAEKRGILAPGGTIIEPTSGNTGISLAAIAKAKGYRAIIVMPDSMSAERQTRIKSYGAEIVLTPGEAGMAGAIRKAEELAKEIPGSFIPNQFENKANAIAHYETTGPEIWAQTAGKVDVFLAGVGTGGTITGVGRYLKEKNSHIRIVAVEPDKSPVLSKGKAGSHGIQGIGAGFVPGVLDRNVIDAIVTVRDEDAFATAKEMGKFGVPVGISAGAAVWAASRIARENPETCVVTLLPDSADRYGSLGL